MKVLSALSCALVLVAVAGLTAQSSKQSTTTKITVKDGKDVKVTGCIQRGEGAGVFVLTKVADKHGALSDYMLVSEHAEDLAEHVGDFVEIKGKATDRGDAKVKIETHIDAKDSRYASGESRALTALPDMPFLGVHSLKLIAGACR